MARGVANARAGAAGDERTRRRTRGARRGARRRRAGDTRRRGRGRRARHVSVERGYDRRDVREMGDGRVAR